MNGDPGKGEVSVAPIREAVLEAVSAGATWSSICRELGWKKHRKREPFEDVTRLKRALGIVPYTDTRGPGQFRRQLAYPTAVAIVRAIDRDPVEFGL